MSDIKIQPLDQQLVRMANSNSMSCKRGDYSASDYEAYCNEVLSWPISDAKKQNIINQIYKRHSEILRHEAQHVSVLVAGPSRYNAKKLDHSDIILRLSAEFVDWFDGLKRQVQEGQFKNSDAADIARLVEMIEFCDQREELNPTIDLCKLATKDPEKFMELFERLKDKYRWRKNSTIYKLYTAAQNGTLLKSTRETFFEDENLTAYTMASRAYIKFTMKPKRQLIVALKSRKWWWNSRENAWSTYLDKLDREWVASISERYSAYV